MEQNEIINCIALARNAIARKYKHNRNPLYAGLWDDSKEVRIGMVALIGYAYAEKVISRQQADEWLGKRLKVETEDVVRRAIGSVQTEIVIWQTNTN